VEYGGKILHDQCDTLIAASGTQSTPVKPDIPGLGTFQWPVVHTGAWDSELDCKNKRIGVIGNGSSDIQAFGALQPDAKSHNALHPKLNLDLHELHGSIHTLWRQLPIQR
jgi:cation diffusion facilitator CzcD-associated flavoprotein CzcO